MFIKYYFKIKYVKGINNTKVDAFSKKAELQGKKKPLDIILKLNKNKKIRYNYLQLAGTHKALKSL